MSERGPEAGDGAEFGTLAERSLHDRLEVVRADPPQPESHLERRVATTLRWQSLVVVPLHFASVIAGGVLAGLRVASNRSSRS